MNHSFMHRLFTMMLSLLCAITITAQEKNDTTKTKQTGLSVMCSVADHITHNAISKDTLRGELILAADSSFVDTARIDSWGWGDVSETMVSVNVTKPGKYFIRLFAMGYDPKYVPFEIKKIYKNEVYKQLKTAYMRRQKRFEDMELDEVVVKATKLKFYMDGDTLVYDADAFSMAEGSMLGQLMKKLPGVEVKKGGEITVNGKKVDAMLLNGKDFFDSDRELLLDNMPTYMVKNIQSFERTPESVKGSNRAKSTQKELVMNVKLKKEYNTGWMSNITGGGGATFSKNDQGKLDTKFLGRLFAVRFDDRSRLMIYAGANNVNDGQTPGENGEYQNIEQTEGITKTYKAGVNGFFEFKEDTRYMGSIGASYTDTENEQNSSSETFLEGGNTFSRSFNKSRSYNYSISTNQYFYLNAQGNDNAFYKNLTFDFSPQFSYSKSRSNGESASLTLSQDVANNLGKAWMDSIMSTNAGELIRKFAINRSISQSKSNGHSTNASLSTRINLSPAHNDLFDFGTNIDYSFADSKTNSFNHDYYDYPQQGSVDFRNTYAPNTNRSHSFSVSPHFDFAFDKGWRNIISVRYSYDYSSQESNQSLYLLNKLNEYSSRDGEPIGNLPSMDEMLLTMDHDNSSYSKTVTNTNNINLNYSHGFTDMQTSDVFSMLSFDLRIPINNEKIDYRRGTQVDTTLTRTTVFLNPSVNYYLMKSKTSTRFSVNYGFSISAPSLMSMIPFVDTSNPLVENQYNTNLKNTFGHNASMQYSDKYGRVLFNFGANGNITQNQVASGFVYNKETGKRIVRPENVNGNWNASVNSGVDFPLDKDEKWRLSENVNYSYSNSVDLSGSATSATEAEAKATRSIVGTGSLSNVFELNWRPNDKMTYSVKSMLSYQHSNSERQDFTTINAFDFNYGATANIELPLGFAFDTDITMYQRRGYSDETMNTNELVWNVRLSKKLLKGNLLIQADGFDILGKLSNIRRTINAQGKTETFTNVIPSYFLLHATYRFNKYPKNKKKEI